MAPIINAQRLTKSFGAKPLFENVSFTVSDQDRIGLIGPNGSGKSTLLRILAGQMSPDEGEIAARKRTRLIYVEQDSRFAADATIRSIIERAQNNSGQAGKERDAIFAETLGRAGFEDLDARAGQLSGGWQKRLALVEALVQRPDVLLLDEPTNHLDVPGIEWLEEILEISPFASVIVSHDRYFLENVTSEIVELNRTYPNGVLRVRGTYSEFLIKKEEFLHAQAQRQEALENLVHREIEWLRRGAKARTRKSKARIDRASELMVELSDLNDRMRTVSSQIDFDATDRKTRRLIELENVAFWLDDGAGDSLPCPPLFENVNFVLTAGMRLGLAGPNGSGKTTLLRLLHGSLQPSEGEIRRAERLRIVYFDQTRALDPDITLRRALAPEGDSVIYRGRVIHVAGWAARFLFTGEQLGQPIHRLSGGERARVLIAQLMLQPADILLLDEPTNDLDIPTMDILEESLLEFPGSLAVVTHDRYMLDRIANVIIGLDGKGHAERFAGYSQWEASLNQPRTKTESAGGVSGISTKTGAQSPANSEAATSEKSSTSLRKKLSYLEAREYAGIEDRIAAAEEKLRTRQAELDDPTNATDATRLLAAQAGVDSCQQELDRLYARWAELEEKKG